MKAVCNVEQSNMAGDTWTEYLCLRRGNDGFWSLDIRGYEVVGEISDYQNEDGELPKKIDGKEVIGTEDDFVIVNNLVLQSEAYPVYTFQKFNEKEFDALFGRQSAEWCTEQVKRKVREAILNYAR